MDGVLVDSEEAKIGAWLSAVTGVCHPSPELAAELDRYNRAHRGIPRAEKFRHVITSLTAADYTLPADVLETLLATYAASVPFVGIGSNIPASDHAMLEHAETLGGLLGREEQIADAVLKSAVAPGPAHCD